MLRDLFMLKIKDSNIVYIKHLKQKIVEVNEF